jgi:hypothetical protein
MKHGLNPSIARASRYKSDFYLSLLLAFTSNKVHILTRTKHKFLVTFLNRTLFVIELQKKRSIFLLYIFGIQPFESRLGKNMFFFCKSIRNDQLEFLSDNETETQKDSVKYVCFVLYSSSFFSRILLTVRFV